MYTYLKKSKCMNFQLSLLDAECNKLRVPKPTLYYFHFEPAVFCQIFDLYANKTTISNFRMYFTY